MSQAPRCIHGKPERGVYCDRCRIERQAAREREIAAINSDTCAKLISANRNMKVVLVFNIIALVGSIVTIWRQLH